MQVLLPKFDKRGGVVPVIIQDQLNGDLLGLVYTDKAGFLETLETGFAVFYSTSRKKRWKKGEESGHTIQVVAIHVDCDGDAVAYRVKREHPVCHCGAASCFFRSVTKPAALLMPANVGEKETLDTIECPVHPNFLQVY